MSNEKIEDKKKENFMVRGFRKWTANSYKWVNLRFGQTKVASNLESLQKYK